MSIKHKHRFVVISLHMYGVHFVFSVCELICELYANVFCAYRRKHRKVSSRITDWDKYIWIKWMGCNMAASILKVVIYESYALIL